MRRIFTLSFFTLSLVVVANAQTCPTATSCPGITENFNSDAGGFTGSGGFTLNSGNFQTSTPLNSNGQTLISGDFSGTSPAVIGFTSTYSANSAGTYTITVRNATTDAVLATCTYDVINGTTNACLAITNPLITGNVYFQLVFNNANGANGVGTLTFDDFRTNLGEAAVLPVTFISLNAQKANEGTQVSWKVGTETNVKLYEVERSINGGAFARVGFVNATGASAYSFTDAQPTEGTVLYRVKNVDFDGRSKYSSTINFKNGLTSIAFKAFPLPAQNLLTVQHTTASDKAQINIASTDGKTLRTIMLPVGATQTDVNLTGLKSGMYLLRFTSGKGKVETMKILKQ